MTFADRVLLADAMRRAPCPSCRALNTADPSLRIPLTCRCGLRLMPRKVIGGVEMRELTPRGVA